MTDPLFILAVLAAAIVVAEWLARHTLCRHLGATLLVLVVAAVVANLGVIPTRSEEAPIYGGMLDYVMPLSIFWLLLRVNLGDILRAGLPMIGLFLVGSLGTAVGVVVAMRVVGSGALGEHYRGIGGLFVGTYTGGGVNMNALAVLYKIQDSATLYAAIAAVDNFFTTVWMIVTIAIPKGWAFAWRKRRGEFADQRAAADDLPVDAVDDAERVSPLSLGWLLAGGVAALGCSNIVAAWFSETYRIDLPPIILLTTIGLGLAQLPIVRRNNAGSQVLGMFSMYLFLAVIGALCDVRAIVEVGQLAATLVIFVTVVIVIHALLTFAAAALFRVDVEVAAVASQANIGGATTALGLARSLGRRDLALPAVLVGSFGYAIGTYLGYFVAERVL